MNDAEKKKQIRLGLHESICRCPECKGTTDKARLCARCKPLDAAITEIMAREAR